jgi:hypothetical protein
MNSIYIYTSPPESLEPRRICSGVADGVLDVAVAEVVLNEPRVRALVGQREAASVPQHVRVSIERESGQLAVGADRQPRGPAVQGRAPVADKKGSALGLQPGPFGKPCLERPQLVAAQRVRGRESLLEPGDVEHAAFDVHLGEPEATGFRDPEAMPEHQQQKAAVAGLVPAAACGVEKFFHFDRGEVFPVAHRFVQCSVPGNARMRLKAGVGYHDIGQNSAFCPMSHTPATHGPHRVENLSVDSRHHPDFPSFVGGPPK